MIFFYFNIFSYAKIDFSSDEVTINAPNIISASGNTKFSTKTAQISSDLFNYDLTTSSGMFHHQIRIHYLQSFLSADSIEFNTLLGTISGLGNISFKASNMTANSNQFFIDENKRLTLSNNVLIKRNGSQIKSNELIYNLETDSIISNERVKLKLIIED